MAVGRGSFRQPRLRSPPAQLAHSGPGSMSPITVCDIVRQGHQRCFCLRRRGPLHPLTRARRPGSPDSPPSPSSAPAGGRPLAFWNIIAPSRYGSGLPGPRGERALITPRSQRFARALLARGLPSRRGVVLTMGSNAPPWAVAALGTIFAGGVPAGVYATSSAATCTYIARDAGASMAVCEDAATACKFLDAADRPACLQGAVLYTSGHAERHLAATRPDAVLWEARLRVGKGPPRRAPVGGDRRPRRTSCARATPSRPAAWRHACPPSDPHSAAPSYTPRERLGRPRA